MRKIFRKNINKKKVSSIQGFSLIEIVLILFIVAFVFTGIYITLSKTSQHEKDSRYALIAANLAQEGIEMIRNKRDENLIEDSNRKIKGTCTPSGVDMDKELDLGDCIPYWDGSKTYCNSTKKKEMRMDGDIYRNCDSLPCTGKTEYELERYCNISTSSDTEIKAKCTVSWKSPSLGITKQVEVEGYLTNWQEN